MLILAKRMSQLRFSTLASLYEADTLQAEQDLYAYLQEDLFPQGLCCIWEENGRYVSALRLQAWRDGYLLEGLQTHRDHRGKGYAQALLGAVLEATQYDKVYAHISRKNAASVAVHTACGFRKILPYATYLDGSVYHNADTYVYEKPRCD